MRPAEFPALDALNRGLPQHLMSGDCLDIGCIALFIHDKAERHLPFDTGVASERRVKRHWSGFEIWFWARCEGRRAQQ